MGILQLARDSMNKVIDEYELLSILYFVGIYNRGSDAFDITEFTDDELEDGIEAIIEKNPQITSFLSNGDISVFIDPNNRYNAYPYLKRQVVIGK